MASYLATPCKEMFATYEARDFGIMKMGNTSHSKIVGIDEVCIQADVGCTMTLKDVRHVPDVRLNLISKTSLDRACYASYFGNGKWKSLESLLLLLEGRRVIHSTRHM